MFVFFHYSVEAWEYLAAHCLPVPRSAPAASQAGTDRLSRLRETGAQRDTQQDPRAEPFVSSMPGNATRH